ncbi:MAG TPA: hypothetical protein VK162_15900 [Streptosporangiaceae bacterium]|nr:hypothetical protein [Streptosporangiaceae bacterium]
MPAAANGLPEDGFDYSQSFEVDLGRAAVIAAGLPEFGYPLRTADVVTAELARPGASAASSGASPLTSWRGPGDGHECGTG